MAQYWHAGGMNMQALNAFLLAACVCCALQLDQSVLAALKTEIQAKAEIKGNLDTYKYYDNVGMHRSVDCALTLSVVSLCRPLVLLLIAAHIATEFASMPTGMCGIM
jgi:hypothetical protein